MIERGIRMANTVTVKELVDSSGYIVLSGEEFLGNKITTSEISRPGVELTGFFNFYPSARIQLLGENGIDIHREDDRRRATDRHEAPLQ